MEETPTTKYLSIPWPVSWLLKLKGADLPFRFHVGLERNNEVLLKPYCPPYYNSMKDAVESLVHDKFGKGGIYDGKPDLYKKGDKSTGWKDPEGVTNQVSGVSDQALKATIDHFEYLWEKHRRFPVNFPAFSTAVGFQAGHIDVEFYDELYKSGTLSKSHRHHMEDWHG
jgi:hypothetical protein